jgi:hypothetical protein
MTRPRIHILFLFFVLAACVPNLFLPTPTPVPTATATLTASPTATVTPSPTATPKPLVPQFDHIVIIAFENREFGKVIGNPKMPTFNRFAQEYTLLTQFYAITHPSLPNYIAMIGGDTFEVDSNCHECFVSARSLPDLIEESGRTWKTYQQGMPGPCYVGDYGEYAQKHNPFIYFDPIRLDGARCERSIVPLDTMLSDIETGTLPNFIFITPDMCNSGHDCSLDVSDEFLDQHLSRLIPALEKEGSNYLIVLTWDEGQGDHGCCGLPEKAGGRIAVVLISPLVKNNFEDETPYTHYSLLKTISQSWGLEYLGHAADDAHQLIVSPWR